MRPAQGQLMLQNPSFSFSLFDLDLDLDEQNLSNPYFSGFSLFPFPTLEAEAEAEDEGKAVFTYSFNEGSSSHDPPQSNPYLPGFQLTWPWPDFLFPFPTPEAEAEEEGKGVFNYSFNEGSCSHYPPQSNPYFSGFDITWPWPDLPTLEAEEEEKGSSTIQPVELNN